MPRTTKEQVQQMLAAAAAACEDKKAEDIRILALDPAESGLTDYFLIATGNSDRQNVAITDEIELRLKHEFSTYPNSVEGRRQGEWILMDYVDFIVHVFNAEKRAFYSLERLRKSATVLSIEDLNTAIKTVVAAGRKKPTLSQKGSLRVSAASGITSSVKKIVVKRSVTSNGIKKSVAKKAVAPRTARKKSSSK